MSATRPIKRGYLNLQEGSITRQLHYRYCGNPTGPALVLLHQSPSSSEMFEALMAELPQNFQLLAPDTPGFGDSDAWSEDSIALYAQALRDWLQALGIAQCLVFGHHTGSSIAVQLAFDGPGLVRALSICGPTLLNDELKNNLPGLATPFKPVENGDHVAGMWARIRDKDREAPLALSLRETLLALKAGTHYEGAYKAVVAQDFADQLAALDCPVQVFAGGQDALRDSVEPSLALLKRGEGADMPAAAGTYICDRYSSVLAGTLGEFFIRQLAT